MSQQFAIAGGISFQSLRDYIFEHKVNRGDSLVLNPQDFHLITEEIKQSEEPIEIPINILGILLINDTTNTVDNGKIQIIKNEQV